MRVLITGGAGFLGTRLARALLQRGTLRGQRIERLVLADLAETREALGGRAALNLPALTVTVQQMLDALREVGGEAALRLVRYELPAGARGVDQADAAVAAHVPATGAAGR